MVCSLHVIYFGLLKTLFTPTITITDRIDNFTVINICLAYIVFGVVTRVGMVSGFDGGLELNE